ncbi:polysaccharide pyruvyl transferase family protein [Mordavella massiliensis]|uniref:polysaccharide pyruvyl transferase family protein n=1 Tax=Mordavella massiliensis TaxID=1871024 RepID=UPI0021095365|nr:polysaccharide pyruvyl transferase family protein [Mordavella massiliensis]
MNLKIITMHAMHNPGSIFQAYAIQQYLSRGNNTELIDYRPSYFYTESNRIKFLIKKLLYFRVYSSRSRKFDGFIKDNFILTQKVTAYDELKNQHFKADAFVVGSDQLWNSDFECGKDDAYVLAFTDKPKISYATSVGKQSMNAFEIERLSNTLKDFVAVSVREERTACQLEKLINKKVKWVCDPVFLLEKDDYIKFVRKTDIMSEPYVMVYLSEASDMLTEIVGRFKEKGYRIILFGGFTKRCDCDYHIKDAGPIEFLSYIYNAEYVISSSFHATAFCHIFHKKFATLLPKSNSERIMSLLRLSGLEDRAVRDSFNSDDMVKEVDWKSVDSRIRNHITESKIFLDMSVEEAGRKVSE